MYVIITSVTIKIILIIVMFRTVFYINIAGKALWTLKKKAGKTNSFCTWRERTRSAKFVFIRAAVREVWPPKVRARVASVISVNTRIINEDHTMNSTRSFG